MGANWSHDDLTSCASSHRHSAAYEPSRKNNMMSASTPSLRPPSAPPSARSSTRVITPLPAASKENYDDSSGDGKRWHPPGVTNGTGSKKILSQKASLDESMKQKTNELNLSIHKRSGPLQSSLRKPSTSSSISSDFNLPRQSVSSLGSGRGGVACGADGNQGIAASVMPSAMVAIIPSAAASSLECCDCKSKVRELTDRLCSMEEELSKTKDTVTLLQEKEKLLRERLSEQARRHLEKGGTVFENINLGDNRPTQLIRRYGNLYSEARLDALDALDDLPEVAQFKNLKSKLLLSVIVLAFRNAKKNLDETKAKIKQLLHYNDIVRLAENNRTAVVHPSNAQSGLTSAVTSSGVKPAVAPPGLCPASSCRGLKKEDAELMTRELDDVIAMYLRRTVDYHNLSKNYEEVCDRVWATLYDFPNLSRCQGLLRYIEECVRLAWALTIQNPPLLIDYDAKTFNPDLHTKFHTSDPDSESIKCVIWPMLREGSLKGACVHKAVVVT